MNTRRLIVLFILINLLGFIFMTTSPEKVPALMLVIVFVLLYCTWFLCISTVGRAMVDAGIAGWSKKNLDRTVALIALLPTFLLVLQSIGQLTLRDVLLATGLFILLYLYFNRLAVQNS